MTAPGAIAVDSPAKANLFLDILGRRGDGFHDLRTIFVAIDLADRLEARLADRDSLSVGGPLAEGVPVDATNLVLGAIARLREEAPVPPLAIHLEKRIPVQAGLGGGSSNAAAALRIASAFTPSPLSTGALERIAASIGSDCAFFVRGGAALGEGRGEVLRPLPAKRRIQLLVVSSGARVPTGPAFAALQPGDLGAQCDAAAAAAWLAGEGPLPPLRNAFERGVAQRWPEVAACLAAIRGTEPLAAMLSGSGGACFGLYEDEAAARAAERALAGRFPLVRACKLLEARA